MEQLEIFVNIGSNMKMLIILNLKAKDKHITYYKCTHTYIKHVLLTMPIKINNKSLHAKIIKGNNWIIFFLLSLFLYFPNFLQ